MIDNAITFTYLENTRNVSNLDLFKNSRGHWIYFDNNKKPTADIKLAKYQKWKKD